MSTIQVSLIVPALLVMLKAEDSVFLFNKVASRFWLHFLWAVNWQDVGIIQLKHFAL